MALIIVSPKIKTFVYDMRGFRTTAMEAEIAAWEVSAARHTLAYDTGTVIFVVGEVVSGATGVGVVTGLASGSDATSGTLLLDLTTAGFVGDEAITGSISGAAEVATGSTEVPVALTIGSVCVAANGEYVTACVSYSDQEQS